MFYEFGINPRYVLYSHFLLIKLTIVQYFQYQKVGFPAGNSNNNDYFIVI